MNKITYSKPRTVDGVKVIDVRVGAWPWGRLEYCRVLHEDTGKVIRQWRAVKFTHYGETVHYGSPQPVRDLRVAKSWVEKVARYAPEPKRKESDAAQ